MASITRHPITIGDTTYDVSPLDDAARDSLDRWVRERYLDQAAILIEKLPTNLQGEAMQAAMRDATSLTWMSQVGAELMATVDGVARILWEGIRKNHQDVAYETIRAKMVSPENVRKANRVFNELNTDRVKTAGAAKKSLRERNKSLSRKKKSTKGSSGGTALPQKK